MELFARALERPDTAGPVDLDVYSDYRADHRHGLRLAERLVHRPWLDTEWWGAAVLASNENPVDPDHLDLRAAWRQRLAGLQLDLEARHTRYLADDDRAADGRRTRLALGLDWERWRADGERWAMGLDLVRDLDADEWSAGLGLTLHLGTGRGYRDFAPGTLSFRDLRSGVVPHEEAE